MIYAINTNLAPKKILSSDFSSKKISSINIPDDWWFSLSTFDIVKPKREIKVIKIQPAQSLNERVRSLPKTNYWEIKNGDYRSRAEATKLIDKRRNRKIFEAVGLSSMIIISIVIVVSVSYLIANIG